MIIQKGCLRKGAEEMGLVWSNFRGILRELSTYPMVCKVSGSPRVIYETGGALN